MGTLDPSTSLAALGHEARYAALRLLVAAGPDGISAGDLARRLNVAPSNMSFHMSALAGVGLVASERRGQSIIYRAETSTIDGVLARLNEDLT